MKYEYEAVSGDQSLFGLVDAFPHHQFIIKYKGCIYSHEEYGTTFGEEILAERKAKEVKLPVVGDELVFNQFKEEYKYRVVAINDKSIAVLVLNGVNEGHYDSFNISALGKCEIIDQSKQPNPVNMVEEKWVPGLWERFNIVGIDLTYTCIDINVSHILGRELGTMNITSFAKNERTFIKPKTFLS